MKDITPKTEEPVKTYEVNGKIVEADDGSFMLIFPTVITDKERLRILLRGMLQSYSKWEPYALKMTDQQVKDFFTPRLVKSASEIADEIIGDHSNGS